MEVLEERTISKIEERIFVSYAWGDKDHEQKVLGLVETLRQNGYPVDVDHQLAQQVTAIDFMKMMHQHLQWAKKVIVVLSRDYKIKSEGETGGVATEYNLILKDMEREKNKYIFASFESIKDSIIPFGFRNYLILDISTTNGFEDLYRKLSGTPKFNFSPVNSNKYIPQTQEIAPYALVTKEEYTSYEQTKGVLYYNGKKLSSSFLLYATNILGATNSKLSWTGIVERLNAKAVDYDIDLPHVGLKVPDGIPNKRTAFLQNLAAFNAEQQFYILAELCNEFIEGDGVEELKHKLIQQYSTTK